MTDYFVTNILVFFICFAACLALNGAPARLRFYLCIVGLGAWLVPWQILSIFAMQNELGKLSGLLPQNFDLVFESNIVQGQISLPQASPMQEESLLNIGWLNDILTLFFTATLFGAIYFAVSFIRLICWQKQIIKESVRADSLPQECGLAKTNIPIYCGDHNILAMSIGVLQPSIWINESIEDKAQLSSIIIHEQTHIRQHDHLYMIFLQGLNAYFGGTQGEAAGGESQARARSQL